VFFFINKSYPIGAINNSVEHKLNLAICGIENNCLKSHSIDKQYQIFATLSSKIPLEKGN
jgi:hypothetical protein